MRSITFLTIGEFQGVRDKLTLMKILVLSPLYPPDIAQPAPYVKEFLRRLSDTHALVALTYGRLPEKVGGVRIVAVDKNKPLLVRIVRYTTALWREGARADIIYAHNGPSVELPLAFVNFFLRRPLVLHLADVAAHEYAAKHFLRRTLERFVIARAYRIVNDMPTVKPEILPLQPAPREALAAYETSWQNHLRDLETVFTHGK